MIDGVVVEAAGIGHRQDAAQLIHGCLRKSLTTSPTTSTWVYFGRLLTLVASPRRLS